MWDNPAEKRLVWVPICHTMHKTRVSASLLSTIMYQAFVDICRENLMLHSRDLSR